MLRPRHAACCVLLLLAPASAGADDSALAQAREHFTRGETHYRLGHFKDALARYQAAYKLAKRPRLLFNMAQCHRHLGQAKMALFYYKLFRDDWKWKFPGTVPPNQQEVQEHIDRLERELRSQPESAPTRPASQPAPVKPASQPAPVKAPATAPLPQTTPAIDAPPSRLRRPWAWVSGGVGIAAMAAGVALLATRRVDEIVWDASGPPTRVTDSAVPGAVLLGAGAAACGLSAFLFARTPVQPAVAWSGDGVTAAVVGRF